MEQFLELADQRTHPSPTDGGGLPRLTAAPAASPLVADLPALLLAVLPLIQAIDWLESASANSMQALVALQSSVPGETMPAEASAVTSLLSDQMIEQALSVVNEPGHHSGASALVYAADIQPLSLTIDVGDLFSDSGALADVTPRATTTSFVANVENDIFGHEMNVTDTPLQAPSKATVTSSASANPMDTTTAAGDGASDPLDGFSTAILKPPVTDSGASGPSGPLIAYEGVDDEGGAQTFLVVDNSPAPLPKGGDIVP